MSEGYRLTDLCCSHCTRQPVVKELPLLIAIRPLDKSHYGTQRQSMSTYKSYVHVNQLANKPSSATTKHFLQNHPENPWATQCWDNGMPESHNVERMACLNHTTSKGWHNWATICWKDGMPEPHNVERMAYLNHTTLKGWHNWATICWKDGMPEPHNVKMMP